MKRLSAIVFALVACLLLLSVFAFAEEELPKNATFYTTDDGTIVEFTIDDVSLDENGYPVVTVSGLDVQAPGWRELHMFAVYDGEPYYLDNIRVGSESYVRTIETEFSELPEKIIVGLRKDVLKTGSVYDVAAGEFISRENEAAKDEDAAEETENEAGEEYDGILEGRNEGFYAGTTSYVLDEPLTGCTQLDVSVKMGQYSGNPFRTWLVYGQDKNEKWTKLGKFVLSKDKEDEFQTFTIEFKPTDIVALTTTIEGGVGSKSFYIIYSNAVTE